VKTFEYVISKGIDTNSSYLYKWTLKIDLSDHYLYYVYVWLICNKN